MRGPGHDPGQPAGVALDWGAYVDALVAEHCGLATVAERLAANRRFTDDVESIARALRRLRGRGTLPGGKWGDRLLATFGLPRPVDARLRFMGSYHQRFVDLEGCSDVDRRRRDGWCEQLQADARLIHGDDERLFGVHERCHQAERSLGGR